MLFLFLVFRSAVLSLHPSSSTCSRLCFVGCWSKEFICIARLPVCLPCTSTWRCATCSPGVGSVLRTMASYCGFYGTAEIRFSAMLIKFVQCIFRNIDCAQGTQSLHSRWNLMLAFSTELTNWSDVKCVFRGFYLKKKNRGGVGGGWGFEEGCGLSKFLESI